MVENTPQGIRFNICFISILLLPLYFAGREQTDQYENILSYHEFKLSSTLELPSLSNDHVVPT